MLSHFRTVALIGVGCFLTACAEVSDESAADDVAVRTGTVDLEIGAVEGDGPDVFGALSNVALDERGWILAVDRQADEVRVFDASGAHVFSIGRSGAGPGELAQPCCIGFGPEGLVWVRDNGNARHDAFELGADGARYVRSVPMAHSDVNRWAPVTFDAAGRLIDIGSRTDRATGEMRTFRLHLDSTGRVVRELAVHEAPDDSTGVHTVELELAEGLARRYMYQPYGPLGLVAHSPLGGYAYALSSRYAVAWYDEDGNLVRHLTRDAGPAPELSAGERARAEEQITEESRFAGISRAAVPFGVPDRKPPLRSLMFDMAGNLWIELSVPEGADRRADVYDREGTLLYGVVWPGAVELRWGMIRGDVAIGVARDSLDVQRVVRLRIGK